MEGDILSKLLGLLGNNIDSGSGDSDSGKVPPSIIASDASTFNRTKDVKGTLSPNERKRTQSVAEIFANVFISKERKQEPDKALKTKLSEKETPAGAALGITKDGKDKEKKAGGGLMGFFKGAGGAAAGILAAAAALALLVGVGPIPGVLQNMSKINFGDIAKALIILAGIAYTGDKMKEGSFGLIAGAAALAILAGIPGLTKGALHGFQDIEWSSVAKGAVILIGIGIAGGMMGIGALGLLAGGAALGILAGIPGVSKGVLHGFQDLEWGTIGKALVTLLGLGVIGTLLGVATPFIFLGALAILALGVALIPLAYAMGLFGEAVGKMAPAIEATSKVIEAFGGVFTKIFNGIAKVIESTATPLRELSKILKELTGLSAGEMLGVAAGITAIGASMVALSGGSLGGSILDGIGGLFGADSPIEKLVQLGAVAADINLLGDSFDNVISGFKEFFSYLDDVDVDNVGEIGYAIKSLAYGFMFLAGGSLLSSVFDGLSKLFGGDSPIERLTKLGVVAGDINKLGDSIKDLKNVELDEIKISDGVFDRIHSLTAAIYKLVAAQTESIKKFGQMNRSAMVAKLFGFNTDNTTKTTTRNTSGVNAGAGFKSTSGENNQVSFKPKKMSGDEISTPKNNSLEALTNVVKILKSQLDTIISFSSATSTNTGKTVEAVKNIKVGNNAVVPLPSSSSGGSGSSNETVLDARVDYSLSPYSLNVPTP